MKSNSMHVLGAVLGVIVTTLAISGDCETNSAGKPKFTRPEERGSDLSVLGTSEAVVRFAGSTDKIERRKLATVIGDRCVAGTLRLSDAEDRQIQQEAEKTLQMAKSPNPNEWSEAHLQIERLWRVAVPTLIAQLSNTNSTVAQLAADSLILMRDESTIKKLVAEAQTTKDQRMKQMLIFTLTQMKEQRDSIIPNRICLDSARSEELYNRLVVPALQALKSAQEQKSPVDAN
jgi:hypothetical protein